VKHERRNVEKAVDKSLEAIMEALIKAILEGLPIAIPDVRTNHPINGGGRDEYDYSRLADCYPGTPNDCWWDLGRRRFVESKKADSNSSE
jgi:hypothetical protein